jgi:predicted ribonuclease YlaK
MATFQSRWVSLIGQAGTGKTLLALAVGLHKTLEEGLFSRIIVTEPVVPVGKQDIGFLPGDKEDKMLPWVQSVLRTQGGQALYGHITLARTIRSAVASLAAELL